MSGPCLFLESVKCFSIIEAPKAIEACPQLDTVPDDVKLSGLTSTVVKNYGTYYECAVKVDKWNEWYEIQKRIFEGIK